MVVISVDTFTCQNRFDYIHTRTRSLARIYLAGEDIVVVQLSPLPHQENSMLETVNTCMTSVYACMWAPVDYLRIFFSHSRRCLTAR